MTELRLTKKQRAKKNQGGGVGPLPLKRKYIRERIEVKSKYGGKEVGNTRTPEEVEQIRATMAMPRSARIARLEAAMEELDKEAAITGMGTEAMRLSGARLLDEEAMRLTQNGDDDYRESVRQVVGNTPISRDEDDEVRGSIHQMSDAEYEREMREAVERRMKDYPEDYRD